MRPHHHRPAGSHRTAVPLHEAERALAEQYLGPGHPLVTSLSRSELACEQLTTTTAVQAAGVVWFTGGWSFGAWLAVGAGLAQAALACRVAVLGRLRRDICLELIAERGGELPLPCIERSCRRLLDERALARLAASIDELTRAGCRRTPSPLLHELADRRVIRAVTPELREVAALLRNGPALRGVALVEWLLTSPTTPLYGSDVEPLRRELRRARYLLGRD